MTAANRAVESAIMPLTISRGRGMEGANEGSARNVLSQRLATIGAEPSSNWRQSKRPSSAIASTPSGSQRKHANVQGPIEASTASAIPRFPPNSSQAKSLTTPKLQTSTTSSGWSAKAASSLRWTRSMMCTLTSSNVHR